MIWQHTIKMLISNTTYIVIKLKLKCLRIAMVKSSLNNTRGFSCPFKPLKWLGFGDSPVCGDSKMILKIKFNMSSDRYII